MVRKAKWIAVSSPDEPVEEVARRALAARLDRVWHYLPRAASVPQVTEHVHQLRVATRRAMAAMKIFEPFVAPRRALWMNKQLKRVRKAAGDARDLDVFIQRLTDSHVVDVATLDSIIASLEGRRADAQKPVEKVRRKLRHKDFPRRAARLVEGVRLREKADRLIHPTLVAAAQGTLSPIVEAFFAAACGDFSDYGALHAFRIEGKQLRYAMEIFAGAFAPAFRDELYPAVEQLQEKLGKINDHATAAELLPDWLPGEKSGPEAAALSRLVDAEKQSMTAGRQAFLEWWSDQRAADMRRRFREFLGTSTCGQTA